MPPKRGSKSKTGSKSQRNKRASSRALMRPWLEDLLDREECHVLRWVDRKRKVFSIGWRHASSSGFSQSKHGDLFYLWAQHTGKLRKNCYGDHSLNKSTFRCAIHSLKDCIPLTRPGEKRGDRAKRTYQFIEPDHPLYNRKRKAKGKGRNKIETMESISDCDTGMIELDDSTWDYFRMEVVSPASDAYSPSSVADIILDTSLNKLCSGSIDTKASVVNIEPTLHSTEASVIISSQGLSESSCINGPLQGPQVPKLEILLAAPPVMKPRIVTEKQADDTASLVLYTLDSNEEDTEDMKGELAAQNNFLPTLSDIPDSYEISFCHLSASSGGTVRVKQDKQESPNLPVFVILASFLQQNSGMSLITFSELDSGGSVEVITGEHSTDAVDCNDAWELTEDRQVLTEIKNHQQNQMGELTELQPVASHRSLSVLVQETGIGDYDHSVIADRYFHLYSDMSQTGDKERLASAKCLYQSS